MAVVESGGKWESTVICLATKCSGSPGEYVVRLAGDETGTIEECRVKVGTRSSGTEDIGRGGIGGGG